MEFGEFGSDEQNLEEDFFQIFIFSEIGYSELIQSFQLSLQVAGLKPQTIKRYTSDTKKFLEHFAVLLNIVKKSKIATT